MDTDRDGIQDADEMGLDGVTVKLFKGGSEVASTSTANGGQWFFTNLDALTDYEVKILGSHFPSGKSLTTANTASNAKDLIDSDATLVGTDAVIAYTTGNAGENNHTLDFGFKAAPPPCTLTINSVTPGPCFIGADGNSYSNLSVTVSWTNPPANKKIRISSSQLDFLHSTWVSVDLGVTSPQTLYVQVPANGSSGNVLNAEFRTYDYIAGSATECAATASFYTVPSACTPTNPCAAGNIGGTVFRDFNSNGLKDATERTGIANVAVNAYGTDNNTYT
jgi:SdrD B-like domain